MRAILGHPAEAARCSHGLRWLNTAIELHSPSYARQVRFLRPPVAGIQGRYVRAAIFVPDRGFHDLGIQKQTQWNPVHHSQTKKSDPGNGDDSMNDDVGEVPPQ